VSGERKCLLCESPINDEGISSRAMTPEEAERYRAFLASRTTGERAITPAERASLTLAEKAVVEAAMAWVNDLDEGVTESLSWNIAERHIFAAVAAVRAERAERANGGAT
jgi:hypothetical protein